MPIDPVSIKERIVTAETNPLDETKRPFTPLFTPEERDYILHAINTYTDIKSATREHPSRHGPGSSPWATVAWAVLDQNVPPKMLDQTARCYLAGLFAGAMSEVFAQVPASGKKQ